LGAAVDLQPPCASVVALATGPVATDLALKSRTFRCGER
jgi:hypothetical protein